MLVINIKDGESIERALKRYKRKCDKTQLIKNIRNIQYYIKPSSRKREDNYRSNYRYKMKNKDHLSNI